MASNGAAETRRGALRGDGTPDATEIPGRNPRILVFHGYGGTPREVDLVAGAARALGLAARAPLLPGHGTHASDLAKTRFEDWLAAARDAHDAPRGPAVIAGLSMGSLLAATLAAESQDEVRGLVLLANAFWLHPVTHSVLSAMRWLRVPDFNFPKPGSDIADPLVRRAHLTYGAQPLHAAIDLARAAAACRDLLPKVRCPTLIVHGAMDRVCPVSNAWRVAQRLGTSDVSVLILPRSRHVITRDSEREVLSQALRTFFARCADVQA